MYEEGERKSSLLWHHCITRTYSLEPISIVTLFLHSSRLFRFMQHVYYYDFISLHSHYLHFSWSQSSSSPLSSSLSSILLLWFVSWLHLTSTRFTTKWKREQHHRQKPIIIALPWNTCTEYDTWNVNANVNVECECDTNSISSPIIHGQIFWIATVHTHAHIALQLRYWRFLFSFGLFRLD